MSRTMNPGRGVPVKVPRMIAQKKPLNRKKRSILGTAEPRVHVSIVVCFSSPS